MHDSFHILGVSDRAPAAEIRLAFQRRAGRSHPDFRDPAGPGGVELDVVPRQTSSDAAIDFVDSSALVDRMQRAFFMSDRGT